jgi:hypothetical protein
VVDVRASGDDARGELCPANLRNMFIMRKGGPTCAASRVERRHFHVILDGIGKFVWLYVDGKRLGRETPL